jgi:hypothetical protein
MLGNESTLDPGAIVVEENSEHQEMPVLFSRGVPALLH